MKIEEILRNQGHDVAKPQDAFLTLCAGRT